MSESSLRLSGLKVQLNFMIICQANTAAEIKTSRCYQCSAVLKMVISDVFGRFLNERATRCWWRSGWWFVVDQSESTPPEPRGPTGLVRFHLAPCGGCVACRAGQQDRPTIHWIELEVGCRFRPVLSSLLVSTGAVNHWCYSWKGVVWAAKS